MKFRTLSSVLMIMAASMAAYAQGTASVLSEGRWVKVKVTAEGIQQISHEQLRAWGFDDPEAVKVYGYGGTALALGRLGAGADDLPATPSLHTADGRLLFYGDADVRLDLRNFNATENLTSESGALWRRNVHDTGGYYFLSDADTGAETLAPLKAPEADTPVQYTGHIHADIREIDAMAPISMGVVFGERLFTASEPVVLDIDIRDRVASELSDGSTGRAAVLAYGIVLDKEAKKLGTSGSSVEHTLGGALATASATHNRANAASNSVGDFLESKGNVTFGGSLPEGDISGTLSIRRPAAADSYEYIFDRSAMIYARRNRLADGTPQLIMNFPVSVTGRNISIADAGADTRLWDVTDPAAVRELQLRHCDDGSAVAAMPEAYSSTRPGRMVLFDATAQHLQPEYAGEVAPQNIHGAETPVLAIITTDELEPYARMLAEAHERTDGIKVGVFRNTEVLNEFSSGALTPMAYRRMARMFYDRDPATFRYLLLIGPSTWDPRGGVTGNVSREMLAVHECEVPNARLNVNTCYASDAYVGCLDDFSYIDGYRATMTIGVGRISARTDAEAVDCVLHTIDYLENRPSTSSFYRALMSSAAGDRYEHHHFSDDVTAIFEASDRGFVVNRLPMLAYPAPDGFVEANRQLGVYLSDNRGFFNYFGHASTGKSLGDKFYSPTELARINYDTPPMALLTTCQAFSVDQNKVTLSPAMLAKRGGGAIGIVAATRSVFSDYNQQFGLAMARAYTTALPGDAIGDVYRTAHNTIMTAGQNSGACYNTKCYNLCGDPALRLSIATLDVELESAANATDGGTPAGMAPLRLSGRIADADGNTDTSFNGTADIVVFDTPVPGTVQIPDPNVSTQPEVIIKNIRLASATATVTDGLWEAEIFLPAFSRPGTDFAVSVDATSAEGTGAHGYFTGLPTAAQAASTDGIDTSAPEIVEMYIDTPDFADGDITGPDVCLVARISVPATGLNISAAALRGASRAILDGASPADIAGHISPDGDGYMMLAMPYSGLTDGRHNVRLCVANNAGLSSERTLGFTVSSAAASASLAVEERPARSSATLSLEHALGDGADATLIVEDHAGNTVVRRPFSGSWDLADTAGKPVPDGVYHAYVLLRSGLRRTATPRTEIIVVRE